MKINSINNNNNYQPQRQPSFKAIAGKNFRAVLHSMLTTCNGPEAEESLMILNNEELIPAFAQALDKIRIRPFYYDINPIVTLRDNGNDSYSIGIDALGIMSKNTTLNKQNLQKSSNVLATIIHLSRRLAGDLEAKLNQPMFRNQLEQATRKSEHRIINDASCPEFTYSATVQEGLQNLMRFLRHEVPNEQFRPVRGVAEA